MSSMGFPGGSADKESTYNTGDLDSISELGTSPGEGNSYPLQYSGLENSMDCIVPGVSKTQCLVQKISLKEWKDKSEKIFVIQQSRQCQFDTCRRNQGEERKREVKKKGEERLAQEGHCSTLETPHQVQNLFQQCVISRSKTTGPSIPVTQHHLTNDQAAQDELMKQ